MQPAEHRNPISDFKFRNICSTTAKRKLPPELPNANANYIVNSLKTLFETEPDVWGLEILETIEQTLKQHLSDENITLINSIIVYLLTNRKDIKLDNNVEMALQNIPFNIRKKLIEVIKHLKKRILPKNAKLLFKSKTSKTHQIKQLDFKYLKSAKDISEDDYKDLIEEVNQEFSEDIIAELVDDSVAGDKQLNYKTWLIENYNMKKNYISWLSCDDFMTSVLELLSLKKNNEELQNDFIELLGFDLFELIIEILSNRENLLCDCFSDESSADDILVSDLNETNVIDAFNQLLSKTKSIPPMPPQLQKLEDLIKIAITPENKVSVPDKPQQNNEKKPMKRSAMTVSDLHPNIHDQQQDIIKKIMLCGKITNVPTNATSKYLTLYDEISIPPQISDVPVSTVPQRSIETLDVIGRMVFSDIKCFNRIQSEVFNIAYNTNENMLVCAPTGSGKTNIALLTIVHQIKKYIENNVVHLEQFKIVYISPMKALAAEMTRNFGNKLACLNIKVKELTGDMQLTRKEILDTQMLVTTPEKWDVISRKGTADVEFTNLVKLLIIDEVHLLNTDRGPVIEALVARTLRQIITSQNMIRIVGLSATLPSYMDVANFLRVNPDVGLFFFDNRYRSVPLVQTFIGVKTTKSAQYQSNMNEICFEKVVHFLRDNKQVLVFVHARNQTVQTANFLKDTASKRHSLQLFIPANTIQHKKSKWGEKTSSSLIEELLAHGLGIHHAGLRRHERSTTEKRFLNGTIKVLVCTATLAWGINLPAHAVVIKGTEIYDAKKGKVVDLDILDVLQIFGRAGRPQFDTSGHGIIITAHEKINYYLSALTNQLPIESHLMKNLANNLNAEIVLGTISNIQESVEWLTFTYLFRRIGTNPHVYGLLPKDIEEDPSTRSYLLDLCHKAATDLDKTNMIRYDLSSGELTSTYLGRTASYFYITLETIEHFNNTIYPIISEAEIIYMMCGASEFIDMQVRPDELEDLDFLSNTYCPYAVSIGVENTIGKVYVLMQTYLSRGYIKSVSLASDMEYINQSATRIARALFDIAINRTSAIFAGRCLRVAQAFEKRMWPDIESPVRQFPDIPLTVIESIEKSDLTIDKIKNMESTELGYGIRNHKCKNDLKRYADAFPSLEIHSTLHPITRGVLRVKLFITPAFVWLDKINSKTCENFWMWVEDPENDTIYHYETVAITKSICIKKETLELVFTVPLVEPLPTQYLIRISSFNWIDATETHALSFRDLCIPTSFTPQTPLLELRPLSKEALNNPVYEALYKFTHFNAVQTQIFHTLYHRNDNVLLGAPTGSGKTIAAEICMFRLFNENENLKVVYIAPMKALVRERVEDWKSRFDKFLGKKVVEMTGDVTPNIQIIKNADIIITTPEKWDGLSRGWQNRRYIQEVGLIIIDEIHLLGEDRGPVLEVIVSRTNFIANQTGKKPRIIGLSTAIANAGNLGNWLGIKDVGLYNFRPSVRPVPLDIHITGFHGKHYCPRMLSMNRPSYQAIRQFAPESPTLIFCSSRKQTRLTAIDLITYLLTDADSKRWLNCDESVIEYYVETITDPDLKHFLLFGIGIHHAGLQEKDRKIVEELFVNQKIQVLIATATLAWGVNFPAHLVIIKGTEYFDGKTKRYIDMPITDVLQMMGRAGRPQFDSSGVACVFVQDIKKKFYKQFLYEPFPIESNLMQVLPDHINAEIAAGTITTKNKLMEYMTWTYFYRRLSENPSYYNLHDVDATATQRFLSDLVDSVVNILVDVNCVNIKDDKETIMYEVTFYGQIASFYYLSYKTMIHFQQVVCSDSSLFELIKALCGTEEYATFPVRHNEDHINREIVNQLRLNAYAESCESPHTKVALLIHLYLSGIDFPNQEYAVDFKSAMDQALRILQGMTDMASNNNWLGCTIKVIMIMQMFVQGQYLKDSVLLTLPHVTSKTLPKLQFEIKRNLKIPAQESVSLIHLKVESLKKKNILQKVLSYVYDEQKKKGILEYIFNLPLLDISITIPHTQQTFTKNKIGQVTLETNADYEIVLNINRMGSSDLTIQNTRFPKKKDEGWFICLGDTEKDNLMQIKRVTVIKHSTCSLGFTAPPPGCYKYTLFILSDSYIGLDQQYDIHMKIV